MNPILAHALLSHDDTAPTSWMLVMAGIFGMGSNFRSFAKALAARVPEWGFVLVDLRGHGASQGFLPPHTLASAAEDLSRLVDSLDLPVRAISGHSFGGKVALAYLARRERDLSNAFILDSVPGPRLEKTVTEDTTNILELLASVPPFLPTREAFTEITNRAGLSKRTADWLAMNVRREGDAYRLRLDLPAIRTLLEDYCAQDYWSIVEDPTCVRRIDLVVGAKSAQWSDADLERARALEKSSPHVHLSILKDAAHWIHVDDPVGLLDVMSKALRY